MLAGMSCAISITVLSLVPVFIMMASKSASDRPDAPSDKNFSYGRSEAGRFLIVLLLCINPFRFSQAIDNGFKQSFQLIVAHLIKLNKISLIKFL